MLKYIFFFLSFVATNVLFGQNNKEEKNDIASNVIKEWLIDLNQKGLELKGDSLIVSQEVLKVLDDEAYRKTIYPEIYSWEPAIQFIQKEELKPAFWYFINMYPENEKNKELVIKSVITYDQLFKMDELLINTFYTYSFLDPEIGKINNGVPEIIRPDVLEKKLKVVNEIVSYVQAFRKNQENDNRSQ
ncbi:hypothetical protein GM418_12380 [Maribellus comscasis]|uniref:Uncharacterized protein n=1 Tax=Maribellus comscasis TaxID=2681766 RepID=A0A6I6JWE6_9BACT|nr:hypothetical protein [Maribellus comscasis]QGY44427.1 hypothetical protein GM418_12380 [Maribellus comscasis]